MVCRICETVARKICESYYTVVWRTFDAGLVHGVWRLAYGAWRTVVWCMALVVVVVVVAGVVCSLTCKYIQTRMHGLAGTRTEQEQEDAKPNPFLSFSFR